jgi:hypothetical protein
MNKINMKEIERKVFTSYFDDGIYDMMIGLLFLVFGLGLYLDIGGLIGVFTGLAAVMPLIFKRSVTLPRYGLIKPLEHQKRKLSTLGIASVVVGLLVFFVFVVGSASSITSILRTNGLLLMGLLWGGMLSLLAYFLHYERLYLYALLIAFSFVSGEWLISLPIKMILSGSIILINGIRVMIRFLQRYPKIEIPES